MTLNVGGIFSLQYQGDVQQHAAGNDRIKAAEIDN